MVSNIIFHMFGTFRSSTNCCTLFPLFIAETLWSIQANTNPFSKHVLFVNLRIRKFVFFWNLRVSLFWKSGIYIVFIEFLTLSKLRKLKYWTSEALVFWNFEIVFEMLQRQGQGNMKIRLIAFWKSWIRGQNLLANVKCFLGNMWHL